MFFTEHICVCLPYLYCTTFFGRLHQFFKISFQIYEIPSQKGFPAICRVPAYYMQEIVGVFPVLCRGRIGMLCLQSTELCGVAGFLPTLFSLFLYSFN